MRRGWTYGAIENQAATRLTEYGSRFSALSGPPTPIELIAERLFDLTLTWDDIAETDGAVFGGLRPEAKEIVLNEKRVDLLLSNRGFQRFTIGHELGHWDLHVDHSLVTQGHLFEAFPAEMFFRCEASRGPVWVARAGALDATTMRPRPDTPNMAREVNRYAAALLIPKPWLVEAVRQHDSLARAAISDLARKFDVSFAAMRVRLDELGMAYMGEDGTVYRSRAHASGQLDLLP